VGVTSYNLQGIDEENGCDFLQCMHVQRRGCDYLQCMEEERGCDYLQCIEEENWCLFTVNG
jgi:hypothetical protein